MPLGWWQLATPNTFAWHSLSSFYTGNEALSQDSSCKMIFSANFLISWVYMKYLLWRLRAPDSYEICELAQYFPFFNLLTSLQLNPFEPANPGLLPLTTDTLGSLHSRANNLHFFRSIKIGFTNWFELTTSGYRYISLQLALTTGSCKRSSPTMLIAELKNQKADEFKIKCFKLSHQNSSLMKLLWEKRSFHECFGQKNASKR